MISELIVAGFGGQGALLIGQLITYAGMIEDRQVSWLPSYGPEMRGGTANCSVIVSNDPVGSPVVTEADNVIVLNRPSLDKFEKVIKPGGKLFINASFIDKKAERDDIDVYYIQANDAAKELGNAKVANIVMLGAYIAATKVVSKQSIINAVEYMLGKKKSHLIPINEQAFDVGARLIEK